MSDIEESQEVSAVLAANRRKLTAKQRSKAYVVTCVAEGAGAGVRKCLFCTETFHVEKATTAALNHFRMSVDQRHRIAARMAEIVEEAPSSTTQGDIRHCFRAKPAATRAQKEALVQFLADQALPLRTVEHSFMQTMLSFSCPKRTAVRAWLQEVFQQSFAAAAAGFPTAGGAVAATSDGWSRGCGAMSLVTMTLHAITADWKRKNMVIGVASDCDSSTAMAIGLLWEKMMAPFGERLTPANLSAIVTDGAANVAAAAASKAKLSTWCAAHQLHLCVSGALKSARRLELCRDLFSAIDTARTIARCVRRSSVARNALQRAAGVIAAEKSTTAEAAESLIAELTRAVPAEVPTRWGSTLAMIEGILRIAPAWSNVDARDVAKRAKVAEKAAAAGPGITAQRLELNDCAIRSLQYVAAVLRPLDQLSEILQADTPGLIGYVLPLVAIAIGRLDEMQRMHPLLKDGVATDVNVAFTTAFIRELCDRFFPSKPLADARTHAWRTLVVRYAAFLLHPAPRSRESAMPQFQNVEDGTLLSSVSTAVQQAAEEAFGLVKELGQEDSAEASTLETQATQVLRDETGFPPAKAARVDRTDWCVRARARDPVVMVRGIESELEYFWVNHDALLPLPEALGSTCNFWASNEEVMPHLARAARKLHAIPPSSCAAERVFSAVGLTFTHLRNRMEPETLNMLICLHCNGLNNQQA